MTDSDKVLAGAIAALCEPITDAQWQASAWRDATVCDNRIADAFPTDKIIVCAACEGMGCPACQLTGHVKITVIGRPVSLVKPLPACARCGGYGYQYPLPDEREFDACYACGTTGVGYVESDRPALADDGGHVELAGAQARDLYGAPWAQPFPLIRFGGYAPIACGECGRLNCGYC